MSDLDLLRQAFDDITYLVKHWRRAWKRLEDSAPAAPGSAGFDQSGSSGQGPSDPTGQLAITGEQGRHDAIIDEAKHRVRRITRDLRFLRILISNYSGRRPTAKDRREAERLNTAEPECDQCRKHAGIFEPVRAVSNASGAYDQELPLCRWHTDFARRVGRPATKKETERHARGQQVRLPVD